jgi:DNA primase
VTAADNDPPDGTEALQQLHTRLRDAVDRLETGEQWQAWLAFARGFHRYSFNNVMLIFAQRPDATLVASYRTWAAKDRQVRKGEKALRVLGPIRRPVPLLDDQGHPVLDDHGHPRQAHRVSGFRPVPVFDVSQTDGPPVPQPSRPELLSGDAPAGLWDALARDVAEHGYRLRRGDLEDLHGANGATLIASREIWVRHDVDAAQAVKTLAHELGHVLLHAAGDGGDGVACQGIREVEAESVAFLLCAAHGLAADSYTFPYVATWASGPAAAEQVAMTDIVTRTGSRVMAAAGQLIEATTVRTAPDPAMAALAARAEDAAHRGTVLREETSRALALSVTVDERRTLLGAVADSQEFFRNRVTRSWVPDCLAERGLIDALHSHGLGHAPRGWTVLVDHLADLGYTDDHIEAAGLASRSRNGHLIDRFRDRFTIPVHNADGELVAFIGRVAPGREEDRYNPRYVNSPGTALYSKGDVLFGLGTHRSRIAAGHLPVLCEGPLDALAVDLAAAATGTRMVGLAAGGTAFTTRQAERLTQLVGDRPIVLAFDGDPAGRAAVEAVWHHLTDTGPRLVGVARMPDGTDPADLLSAGQPGILAELVGNARPAAHAVCDTRLDGVDLTGNPPRQLVVFRQLLPYADRLPPHQRTPFVISLANRLDIDVTVAAAEVADRNPQLLADRTIDHCRQLSDQLDRTAATAELTLEPANHDQPQLRLT